VNNLPTVVAQHRARTHDPCIASPTPYRLATAPPRWVCTMSLAERPVDILLPAVVSSFHCICSRHVHVIACSPPNVVYPCCSSPRKIFSFYFALNCSQNHAITSSFPVAVLREFPMLNCSKKPCSSGIPILSRIHESVLSS